MEFKPITSYILAKRVEISKSKGGIDLPNAIKTRLANIIEVGPLVDNEALTKGAQVMFTHHTPIALNEEEYLILTERDILGVFTK